MPHVIVKLYAGKTEAQKSELASKIAEAVMSTLGSSEASISVGIEEFDPREWKAKVFEPDVTGKSATLYKKPGYEPV
jgi:4-oxalocrotonate tautomerase